VTIDLIEFYLWGYLISLNWMLAWQATTIKVKLLKVWLFIRRRKAEVYTPLDFDDYVGFNWGIFGELLSCSICLSHWVGAIVSLPFYYFCGAPISLILISFFTYPVLIHVVLRKIMN